MLNKFVFFCSNSCDSYLFYSFSFSHFKEFGKSESNCNILLSFPATIFHTHFILLCICVCSSYLICHYFLSILFLSR